MLERFYTDICGDKGLGRWLGAGRWLPGFGGRLQLLANRRLPPEIRAKTRTFGWPFLRYELKLRFGSKNPTERFRTVYGWGNDWAEAMSRGGFGNATHIFSMLGEGGPLLPQARRQGLRVVSEIYILLSTERIVSDERKKFPDWETEAADYGAIR